MIDVSPSHLHRVLIKARAAAKAALLEQTRAQRVSGLALHDLAWLFADGLATVADMSTAKTQIRAFADEGGADTYERMVDAYGRMVRRATRPSVVCIYLASVPVFDVYAID